MPLGQAQPLDHDPMPNEPPRDPRGDDVSAVSHPGPTARRTDPSDVDIEFTRLFGRTAEGVWAAPGRINLIGEHTDYNDGYVLPLALPHLLRAALARREDGRLRLRSRQTDGSVEIDIEDLAPGSPSGWTGYPAGVVWALREAGYLPSGCDILIDSKIPEGAGLSSSAALECAVALGVSELCGMDIDRRDLARLAQRAENEFVGMPCGIMDQSAVLLARAEHALMLDTRTLHTAPVPFELSAHSMELLVIDTRAPHRLVDGPYADRRRVCEDAARELGVVALRDVDRTTLDDALAHLDDERTRRRVRHVVTENERVRQAESMLSAGRIEELGKLFSASHASLRDDYEVTVPELDTAAAAAETGGAVGARMTGGGFGGCVIALVPGEALDSCAKRVRAAFAEQGFAEPVLFTISARDGARKLR